MRKWQKNGKNTTLLQHASNMPLLWYCYDICSSVQYQERGMWRKTYNRQLERAWPGDVGEGGVLFCKETVPKEGLLYVFLQLLCAAR